MPRLTDTRCRTAKPANAPYAIQDGRGLYLEVRPTGLKVWRYRYWLTSDKAGRYTGLAKFERTNVLGKGLYFSEEESQ